MADSAITYTKKKHVARIILNRREAGNAFDPVTAQELEEVCWRIGQEKDIYVVTLTGAGDVFCN
ncbi:MAG TPA: enoyl-CoA hydratase-related protein, partial [Dehalococcoidales bacterium]|nr:enoyl-CoA hydratase-related protein [Dehalococcoidales bacterium]